MGLWERIDHQDPEYEPTCGRHPEYWGQREVVYQGREENAHRKPLRAIDAGNERHVQTQQGDAELDVKLKLNRRLSFSLLTAPTLHPAVGWSFSCLQLLRESWPRPQATPIYNAAHRKRFSVKTLKMGVAWGQGKLYRSIEHSQPLISLQYNNYITVFTRIANGLK